MPPGAGATSRVGPDGQPGIMAAVLYRSPAVSVRQRSRVACAAGLRPERSPGTCFRPRPLPIAPARTCARCMPAHAEHPGCRRRWHRGIGGSSRGHDGDCLRSCPGGGGKRRSFVTKDATGCRWDRRPLGVGALVGCRLAFPTTGCSSKGGFAMRVARPPGEEEVA